MGKAELLAELEQEFGNLMKAIEGLSYEQMIKPWFGSWSVRDILAHIIGWHHEMDGVLQRIARGERPVPEGVDYSDPDSWNSRFALTWGAASPAAVVAELKASKELFVSAAQQVPEERFEDGKAAFRIMHATAIDHYKEHYPAILEWRKKEGI